MHIDLSFIVSVCKRYAVRNNRNIGGQLFTTDFIGKIFVIVQHDCLKAAKVVVNLASNAGA